MSSRRGYPSDLTDAQWGLVKDLLPGPSGDGRPEKHPRREIANAIRYLVRSGCPWRYLPADFAALADGVLVLHPVGDAGVTEKLLAALRVKARIAQGREPGPSAEVLDSQSVKGADTVGRDSRGYDAGKKDQRTQAIHRHRHRRCADHRLRPGRLVAGPGRRQDRPARSVSEQRSPACLRRSGLRRPVRRLGQDDAQDYGRDRA